MNKGIRFTDEFKQDAVAQVVERGYAVSKVTERLGISTKSVKNRSAADIRPSDIKPQVFLRSVKISAFQISKNNFCRKVGLSMSDDIR